MNYYLAIDQGTHASRAILYDDNGVLVASEIQSVQLFHRDNGHIEQDAKETLDSVQTVIEKLLNKLPENTRSNIISCGIACQRSTVLACNQGGSALSPAISWQDTRGAYILKNLTLDKKTIRRITGLPVSAHYSASKFHWLLSASANIQNTPAKELYLAPLISYLLLHLTKEKNFAVDHSQAQRTQLFNIHQLRWSKKLINAFGIKRFQLPKVKPMYADYGFLKNTQIPIKSVCGDQNAALRGVNADDENAALINLGSGAYILHTHPQVKAHDKLLSTIAYSSATQIRYCREATVNGAGNAVKWFHQYIQTHEESLEDTSYLNDPESWHKQLSTWLADTSSQNEYSIIFMNSVGGLGSPWWSSSIEPHFYYPNSDQTISLNPENIAAHAQAVIESIAFLLQENLSLMVGEHPLKVIKVSGGLSQIYVLCQYISNLSQIPVERIADKDSTARGVAWLASGAHKAWKTTIDTGFEPKQDQALVQRKQAFRNQLNKLLQIKPQTNWVAHRGDMTHHPENTLLALEFALQQGADAIEFDCQMNADGDFVIIHDDNVQRTSNTKLSVIRSKTHDLQDISVHEPKKYGAAFYPLNIAILKDALTLISKYPKVKAFIEIKAESLRHWGTETVMNALFKKLTHFQQPIIIISFDYKAIAYTQQHGKYAHGWVLKKYNAAHHEKALALKPDFLICNYKKIINLKSLWKGSWQWMLYDIQDQQTAEMLTQRGVQWIETGDIGKMLRKQSTQ